DFITSRGEFLAEKYTKDADTLVTEFLAEIPDGQRERYAAITYNLLSDTYKQSNNFAFMFKAFGSELAQRLEQLHLTQIRLNDIDQAGVEQIVNGSVQQVVFAADEKDPNPSHEACYLIDGDTRTRIGKITKENFHLPLETKAQATINFAPPAQGTFTLPNGKSFTLGGMNKSDSAGEVFFDREILMSIDKGKPNYTPLLMLNNKSLGRLSDRSVKFLKSQGLLERGQNFKLTLTREGLDNASRIYATTANSKVTLELVEISRFAHPDFKQRQFREEEFDVSLGYKENPAKLTGYLHRNGKRISLGEFNRNHKKSADFVRQHRMVGSKPFKVKATSMPTCLDLTIDPESVEYPEAGVNRFLAAASVEKLSTEVNATTQEFLAQAKSYQTIARFGDRTWSDRDGAKTVISSLDLILDSSKVEFLSSLLEKYNFTLVNDSSTALEQRKGFVVYSVPTTAINAADWQDLTANFQLNRVFDEHLGGLPAKLAYRVLLQNNFSDLDLVKDDLLLNQSGELEEVKLDLGFDYPLLDANLPDKTSDVAKASAKLVELVKHSTFLSQIEAITLAKELNRYDYQWLNSRLEPESKIDSPNSAVEVLAGDNLVRAQTILSQFLIPQEELVYQHFTQDYEDEYEFDCATEQLKALLGEKKYSLYQTEVEHLIKENITPVVVASLGVRTPIELLEKRPDVIMPLPEFVNPKLALPMSLGKPGNEVAEALANPQDKNNPEKISRPIKFKGRTYPSTQVAYSALAPTIPRKQTYQLTKDLLEVKFTQHPELIAAIDANGGKNWLNTCRYYNDNDYMSGVGSDSGYIRAVGESYERAKSKVAQVSQVNGKKVISLKPGQNNKAKAALPKSVVRKSQSQPDNPLKLVKPANEKVAYHMKKDLAMADVASQYIGLAAFSDQESSTEKYRQAWGERANTGNYSQDDIVMVSGNGPWRASQLDLKATFETKYIPLLDKAIASGAKIVVGSAKGTDMLVQNYLKQQGYQLKDSGSGYIEAVGAELETNRQDDISKSIQYLGQLNTKTTTAMSFISFANEGVEENFNQAKNSLNTEAAVATKQQMLEVVTEEIDYAVVSDTLRVWGNGASANNALVATFKGVNNLETIAYSAARIGQEFNQSRVSYFIEDPKGQDTLYSFSVANTDLVQIKNTLASLEVKGYTLLPTKGSTKILIPDRNGRMGTVINNLKNHYGQQPKVFTGYSRMVERHQYPSITRTYQSARQRDGREGLCCRGDITRFSSANHGRTRNRTPLGLQGVSPHGTRRPCPQSKNGRDSDKSVATERRVGRVEGVARDDGRRVARGYRLPDSVKPRLKTPLEKQQQAVTKAIPTLAKILNSTSTKKLYQNEQFKLTYNSSNRIMQLVDRGQVKMVAQHDLATNRWISLTDVPSLDEPALAALQQVLEAIEAAPAVPTEAVTNSTPKLRDRLGERKEPSNIAQADDPEAKTAALER
nr:hypothetical protein [Pleurocapsa sp. MO_192.B19]